MTSPDSWIDLTEVARLVRRILPASDLAPDSPPHSPVPAAPLVPSSPQFPWQAGPGESFPELDDLDSDPDSESDLPLPADPGFEPLAALSSDELRHRATRAMKALRAAASQRPPLPPAPQPPRPSDPSGAAHAFQVPGTKLRERLLAYANWVAAVTGCISLRIVDPQGYSLLEREGENDPAMVDCTLKLIATLGEARSRIAPDTPPAGLYLPLGDDQWLGVLECGSAAGRLCLSLVTRAPLSKSAAAELTETLRRTVDPD